MTMTRTRSLEDDLDLTPKRREFCLCCFPKPPSFSTGLLKSCPAKTTATTSHDDAYSIDSKNSILVDDDNHGGRDLKGHPINEISFNAETTTKTREIDMSDLPELGDDDESSTRGMNILQAQRAFFLSLFHMLFSLMLGKLVQQKKYIAAAPAAKKEQDPAMPATPMGSPTVNE